MEITAPKPTAVPLALPVTTRLKLSIISAITDAATLSDGTINRRLLNFFEFFINVAPNPNPNPVNGVKSIDITVDHSRNLWFRLYIPTRSTTVDRLPLLVFFHGGGFVFLSAANFSYDAVVRRLARKLPAVVVSVNYRLAPEHRCPAMYQDGFDVLRFLDEDESFRKLLPGNVDLSRCFLAGDSAGGNLAHHVAVKACQARFQHIKVTGIVAIQPFFGGEERTESEMRLYGTPLVSVKRINWMWNAFLPPGEGYNRDHNYINVSGPNATDLSSLDFPATLVVIAGYDMLQDWQRRYYKWLKNSGKEVDLVEYPSMCHAFYIFPELPESAKLIADVGNFIRKCSKD